MWNNGWMDNWCSVTNIQKDNGKKFLKLLISVALRYLKQKKEKCHYKILFENFNNCFTQYQHGFKKKDLSKPTCQFSLHELLHSKEWRELLHWRRAPFKKYDFLLGWPKTLGQQKYLRNTERFRCNWNLGPKEHDGYNDWKMLTKLVFNGKYYIYFSGNKAPT